MINHKKFLNEQTDYTELKGRSVLSFGEPYPYNGSPIDSYKSTPIPPIISKLISKIETDHSSVGPLGINSCLINRYVGPESVIPEHADDEDVIKPESKIVTISFGNDRDIKFRDCITGKEECLTVSNGSLYIMSQQSQFFWKHRIDKCESADTVTTRYSLTFRCVDKSYKNSTVIVGDSNTKYVTFDSNKSGSIGNKISGKRVPTYTIEAINPEECIGYRNVLVHVGVNNLKSTRRPGIFGDSCNINVHENFCILRDKLEVIRLLCPNSKLIVSPILPTKIGWLNNRALEFNQYLFEYLNEVKQIKCLDFNVFLNYENGLLREDYGCFKDRTDNIHLGKQGISQLAMLVREVILNSRRDFRNYASVVSPNDVAGHGGGSITS